MTEDGAARRPVVAVGDLRVPDAVGVLIDDANIGARALLFDRGAAGRLNRLVAMREGLGIGAVEGIGPAAVVRDDLVFDLAHDPLLDCAGMHMRLTGAFFHRGRWRAAPGVPKSR